MSKQKPNLMERATEIAERDQLHPFPCIRQDTGELIWLIQSRSAPSHHYLLTVNKETIHCPCPQAQHRGICAHAAAVLLTLEAEPQPPATACTLPDQSTTLSAIRRSLRSEFQLEQERRQRAEAERRERPLLWTNDRPFSVWK
jgi:hypothetical protein